MNSLYESILDDEEVLIDSAKNSIKAATCLRELKNLTEINTKRMYRNTDEDILGNKLGIGDIVYMKVEYGTPEYYNGCYNRFGIICRFTDKKVVVCMGIEPGEYEAVEQQINNKFDTKEKFLEYCDYNKSLKTWTLSSDNLFLVKKAKQVNPNVISKLK